MQYGTHEHKQPTHAVLVLLPAVASENSQLHDGVKSPGASKQRSKFLVQIGSSKYKWAALASGILLLCVAEFERCVTDQAIYDPWLYAEHTARQQLLLF